MVEYEINRLMPSSIITDKLDKIIDAFVAYYGEDKREEITNKFKNILILKFCNNADLKKTINDAKISIFKELYEIPEDKYVHLDADEFISYLTTGKPSSIYLSKETIKIITGNEIISVEDIRNNFNNGMYPKIEEFIKRYKEVKERLIPYEERLKRNLKQEEDIKKKYFKQLLEEFKFLIPEEDMKSYENGWLFVNSIDLYFSNRLDTNGHCFDEEHEKKLNDPNTHEWIKESIISDRLRMLNDLHPLTNRGNSLNPPTYSDYLANEESREFIKKTIDVCTRISKRKKQLHNQMTIEIVESLEDYQELRKTIDEKNFADKNDLLGPFVYTSPISCYEENFIKTDNGLLLSPIILINTGNSDFDCTLIHELNHAYEDSIIKVDEKECTSSTGWDYSTFEFSDVRNNQSIRYDGISRGYELMSEYVNEKIAQEITDLYHSRGDYVVSPNRSKNSSSYLVVGFLLNDFLKEFKSDIIESRSHSNINHIYEKVGKENFEELNNLVMEFYNKFGFSYSAYNHLADYLNHVETPESLYISNLVERKNQVLERMREVKLSQTL